VTQAGHSPACVTLLGFTPLLRVFSAEKGAGDEVIRFRNQAVERFAPGEK